MVEPASGISGALGALNGSRPSQGGGDSGSLSSAASELSAAARGFQSTQGQISGQTMAIQQMSMQQQMQSQQMALMINQLNMSISQLSSALAGTASQARMPSVSMQMPSMPFGGLANMAGNAMTSAGRFMGNAAGAAFRGVGAFGGAMAAPFLPGNYSAAMPGQLMGSLGNAGMARSMMMGTGMVDLNHFAQQRSSAAEVQRLGMDRGAFKLGEIMLGAGAGLTGFGMNQLGTMMGGGLGGMLGGGLGRFAGGLLGGPLIGSALMAPVNQVMDQVGYMRGTGEMMGRNAFRFMPGGQERQTFRERGRFGESMANMANSDLLFSGQDMQQVFGGAIENDLMRGVGSSQQARARMRQLKESVKVIGQTLSMSIQDSMSLMSELQGVGIGPGGMTGAVLGGRSSGLTATESLGGQMSFMQRFSGSGLQGAGLMGLAGRSQQMGQTAIQMGLLSPERLAAVGGRQGAQNVYGDVMTSLLQGNMGQLAMAGSMGAGGYGALSRSGLGALGQAGAGASSGNLISFAANQGDKMRDLLNSPQGQMKMLGMVGSIAQQFKGMGDQKDIMKLILKSQGIDGQQASAFMDMMAGQPEALRQQRSIQQQSLADLQVNQLNENFSISGRASRAVKGATMGLSGNINNYINGVQDTAANMTNDARDAILGVRNVNTSSDDLDVSGLRKMRGRNRGSGSSAQPTPEMKRRAKNKLFMDLETSGGNWRTTMEDLAQQFKEATDPEERMKIAQQLLANAGAKHASSPEEQKAIEQAISEQFGIPISSALSGGFSGSKQERAAVDSAISDFRSSMGGGSGMGVFGTAGAAIGAAAGIFMGPMGMALGSTAGAFAGAFGASRSGTDRATVTKLMRSGSAKDLVNAIKSGDKGAEAAAYDALRNKEGFDADSIKRLQAAAGKDPDALLKNMNQLGANIGGDAWDLAMTRAGGVSSAALEQAGLKDIGNLMSGDPESVLSALSQISNLNDKDLGRLQASGAVGDMLASTSKIKAGMTIDQLTAMGVDERLARNVLGSASSLTAESADELKLMQYASAGANDGSATVGGRGGFTTEQMKQQADLAAQIYQTNQLLKEVANVLVANGIKKPG